MKTYVIACFMLFAAMASKAQDASASSVQESSAEGPEITKNEIKLNALFLLLGVFEASYERNLTENSSVGISALTPFDRANIDTDINYYVSPYYRVFFGKKYAAGFFLEGFGMLNSIRGYHYYSTDFGFYSQQEDTTDFAVGIGLGGKWFTKGGFVFEVNSGFGRNLFNPNSDLGVAFVGKFGFNLGYRF